MSATIVAIWARRSGAPRLTTKTRTGSSNLRMRSARRSNCSSAPNAVLKKPSLISASLKLVRSAARRTPMSAFAVCAAALTVPPIATPVAVKMTASHLGSRCIRGADHMAAGGSMPTPGHDTTECRSPRYFTAASRPFALECLSSRRMPVQISCSSIGIRDGAKAIARWIVIRIGSSGRGNIQIVRPLMVYPKVAAALSVAGTSQQCRWARA